MIRRSKQNSSGEKKVMSAIPSRQSPQRTDADEWLDEFPSEDAAVNTKRNNRSLFRLDHRTIVAAVICCIGALGVPTFWWFRSTASGAEVRNGFLKVES